MHTNEVVSGSVLLSYTQTQFANAVSHGHDKTRHSCTHNRCWQHAVLSNLASKASQMNECFITLGKKTIFGYEMMESVSIYLSSSDSFLYIFPIIVRKESCKRD